MISHITDAAFIDRDRLSKSCQGRKMLSYLDAYGTGYDFCRFYDAGNGCVILLINSTMLIDGESVDSDELRTFAHMYRPFRIEGSAQGIAVLSGTHGYRELHRTVFRLSPDDDFHVDSAAVNESPSLDDVYGILSEGFPNLLEYPMWLADTSHRIRHGISRVYTYNGETTASVVYDISGWVLIGQVATKLHARGSGYARSLLKWLASEVEKQGKTALLYALDTRESFYREIGFEKYSDEFVLERIDTKNESAEKGKLSVND